MDTEFPGEMKPEDTKELRESSVHKTMSNEHLLAPNCAIALLCVTLIKNYSSLGDS